MSYNHGTVYIVFAQSHHRHPNYATESLVHSMNKNRSRFVVRSLSCVFSFVSVCFFFSFVCFRLSSSGFPLSLGCRAASAQTKDRNNWLVWLWLLRSIRNVRRLNQQVFWNWPENSYRYRLWALVQQDRTHGSKWSCTLSFGDSTEPLYWNIDHSGKCTHLCLLRNNRVHVSTSNPMTRMTHPTSRGYLHSATGYRWHTPISLRM